MVTPNRAQTRQTLAVLGIKPSRVRIVDVVGEALISVARSPARSLLTALGTVLGAAAVVSIVGLSATASAAVADTFDVLRATQVTFNDRGTTSDDQALTLGSEAALDRLNGVVNAGLSWRVYNGENQPVRRALAQNTDSTIQMPVTAASAHDLITIGAQILQGRTYDVGMERRHTRVGLLGIAAARQLGLTSVARQPVVYLGDTPITIIGIISDTQMSGEILMALTIPTVTAEDLHLPGSRQLDVRTAPGAAQLIAAQGPYALLPTDPDRIAAQAPPDPVLLRHQVEGSLTSLLIGLAMIALGIGVIAIANTTLLAVLQRRAEIGLRRAVGAAPRHIAVMILTETAAIGTIGGIVGTAVGRIIIVAACASKGWAPVLDPAMALSVPFIGTGAGILAGLYPAFKATRITPLEALQR
jgi:putative ABC transport system permease protein